MTNPDNVGGLPPLLHFAVFDEFGKGADDRVWDYGRRCFEAGMKFEGEHGLMTTNAPKRDSAPAGGDSLRALVKELRESLEGVVRVADRNTDEFDRAREAIARASHVFVNAGDSEAQFIADGENLDCPACGGSGHAGDSAPAGSGEAGPILIHAQQLHLDGHMDQCALDELTALLRNLQQGAE